MAFVDDVHDDACRRTAAWAVEQGPWLWQDLARRWLGVLRPEHHAAWDEADEVPARRTTPCAENFAVLGGYCRLY